MLKRRTWLSASAALLTLSGRPAAGLQSEPQVLQRSAVPGASQEPATSAPLDRLLQHLGPPRAQLAWRPDADWRPAALAAASARVLVPGDDRSPFATQWLAEETRDNHVLHVLALRGALGDRIKGLYLRPAGAGPHPAVLLLHDHGARFDIGKEKLIRPPESAAIATRDSAETWVHRYYAGQFVGDALVRQGFAVLAIDALGWGERSRPGFAKDDQQALTSHLMQLGLHWAGIIASDDIRTHRWLRERPEIDASRVAVLGFSMGAQRAWQLAALCPEVWACAAAHWMCTREALLRPGEHTLQGQSAFSMVHPGLASELDHPDMAALIAPRPLLLMGSPEDRLFPWDGVQAAWRQLSRAWSTRGSLALQTTPGGHRFDEPQQRAALQWLLSLQ